MTTPPPNAEQIEAATNVYAIAIMARGSAEAYQSLYEFTVSRDAARDQSVAAEAVKPWREAVEIMNARVAVDAKSYERDQYLIAALRKQLAALSAHEAKQGEGS